LWEQAASAPLPFTLVKIIVAPSERELLHERIRIRFMQMLELGLIDEVQTLFRRGDLDESLPSIRAVGYRQVWSLLRGECCHDEMVERAVAATRQLAKRQFTWLRRERDALCFFSEQRDLDTQVMDALVPSLDPIRTGNR
jgi:tRNA dimethylallyltransferase